MSAAENILNSISLLWKTFTPVEERILKEFSAALPLHIRETYDRQVASINYVQRILDWTEICFYRRGKNRWEGVPQFANDSIEDIKIAKITYLIGGKKFSSTLGGVCGHIFDLVTRPSIKQYAFQQIDKVISIKLLEDPTVIPTAAPAAKLKLPKAYKEFMGTAGGEGINGWLVLPPEEIYSISLAEGDFLLLAEREGVEYLLSLETAPSKGIYYCATSDGAPVVQKGSLEQIMNVARPG
jgi:hypothetical protein